MSLVRFGFWGLDLWVSILFTFGKVMSVSVGLWGLDLWDRYDGVVAHVNRGTEELGGGWVTQENILNFLQELRIMKIARNTLKVFQVWKMKRNTC